MARLFSTLSQWVSYLAEKKILRPLDYQFAKFVAGIERNHKDEIMWLAALTSAQLGQGHICLNLDGDGELVTPSPGFIGLYGEVADEIDQLIYQVDWQQVVNSASTIAIFRASPSEATVTPLVYHQQRLYLQRYSDYEQSIASRLLSMAQPIPMSAETVRRMASLLDKLFAREYYYLFSALRGLSTEQDTQVARQQLVCDYLDVIDPENIHWANVDEVVTKANNAQQLTQLDREIPLSACLNWQKVAAAVALNQRFAVISGGPGTGKTTTVTKLLAAMIDQTEQGQTLPTIKLVAPTGKAAARLTESIGKAVDALAIDPEIKSLIPTESSTLHRLLGAIPGRVEFRHNKGNPLHLDVLVLDEASMVDMPMMHRLLDALPAHARLILLGDKDQLASVEAGAVLSDICDFAQLGYSSQQNERIRELTQFDCRKAAVQRPLPTTPSPMADSLCVLQKSYRFDARSGIGQLAKQVNAANSYGFDQVWRREFSDIDWLPLSGDNYQQLIERMVRAYKPYLTMINTADISRAELHSEQARNHWQQNLAKEVLASFASSRLLCALREGDFGVTGLNQRIEKRLKQRGVIGRGEEQWYLGRPVMVTRNDHGLGLFNGDIGICMWDQIADTPRLKVFFELPDGSIKSILPSRMPEHETAYAMTIHKSQGSEFAHTFMILPADFSPLLSKELIYTGITRAKSRFTLVADGKVIAKGIRHKTIRHSGLALRLISD
ncbi:exodeoxyribonuclease V subunit alpha [Vibrio parahaemolyticus]|uniref:exodeoxyribonuclease V subunit alpha n=1 Tax=Vibrio mediterranei TaxID=689 RepID=UPI0040678C12